MGMNIHNEKQVLTPLSNESKWYESRKSVSFIVMRKELVLRLFNNSH